MEWLHTLQYAPCLYTVIVMWFVHDDIHNKHTPIYGTYSKYTHSLLLVEEFANAVEQAGKTRQLHLLIQDVEKEAKV